MEVGGYIPMNNVQARVGNYVHGGRRYDIAYPAYRCTLVDSRIMYGVVNLKR